MKFLSLLLLLVASTVFGATAQVNNIQQFGAGDGMVLGLTIPEGNAAGYKTLVITLGAGDASNTYAPAFDLSTQTADYQVPNAKTFQGAMICGSMACTGVTDCAVMLGSGTAATTRGTSAPAGPVYWGGPLATGNTSSVNFNSGVAYKNSCISMPFNFTQNTFPFGLFITPSQGYVYLLGKEI